MYDINSLQGIALIWATKVFFSHHSESYFSPCRTNPAWGLRSSENELRATCSDVLLVTSSSSKMIIEIDMVRSYQQNKLMLTINQLTKISEEDYSAVKLLDKPAEVRGVGLQ